MVTPLAEPAPPRPEETVTLEPVTTPAVPHRRRSLSWVSWTVAVLLVGGGVAVWYFEFKKPRGGGPPAPGQPSPAATPATPAAVTVEVVAPKAGGLDRVCVQPGTVEPFEAADLYAKVSGFLAEQTVDIGSRVKRGQVLAKLSVPEAEQQVERDAARVAHAEAQVRQMDARILATEAEAKAADAAVALSRTLVRAKTAYRQYREKQLARIKDLNRNQAIEARLVDEQEDQFLAATEAENAAKEAVTDSTERATAARAKIAQAKADREEAVAGVRVANAELAKARVLLGYTTITSPYDGVVTKRHYSRGDFIRTAEAGGERVPLLAVERTDLMRVVVQVPDRDVPYVSAGDPAALEIDALPGRSFTATVSRAADSEDPATRLMRTEVDIPNPDGVLRRGMYGRATLTLAAGATEAVRVPSAVVDKAGKKPTVRVVRDGAVRAVPVTLGADNGIEAEVLTGLTAADRVVTRASGPTPDGTPATVR